MDAFDRFLRLLNEEQKRAGERTIADVFDTMNEEQKNVVYYLIGAAIDDERKRIISWIQRL